MRLSIVTRFINSKDSLISGSADLLISFATETIRHVARVTRACMCTWRVLWSLDHVTAISLSQNRWEQNDTEVKNVIVTRKGPERVLGDTIFSTRANLLGLLVLFAICFLLSIFICLEATIRKQNNAGMLRSTVALIFSQNCRRQYK